MISFSYKRAALIAVSLTLLTVSIGALPQPPTKSPQVVLGQSAKKSPPIDPLPGTPYYYTARPDLRRCAFPRCGGFFVKRVNHSQTRCHNGRLASECYVAEIDWNGQPEVGVTKALLRGTLRRNQGPHNLGAFRVSESWESPGGNRKPDITFYRVKDLGIRCVAAPCETHEAAMLNSKGGLKAAGVDLNSTGASDELAAEANDEMTKSDGVLIAASTFRVYGPAGMALSLRASRFYLRAGKETTTPQEPPAKTGCVVTGCSRQVCADDDVMTTCQYRAEYACYRRARCERQTNGKCGWTQTPELAACLKNPPKQ